MSEQLIEGPANAGVDDVTRTSDNPAFGLGDKVVTRDTTNNSYRIYRYAKTAALKDHSRVYLLSSSFVVGDALSTSNDDCVNICTPHATEALPAPASGSSYAYGFVQTGGYFPTISALSGCAASQEIYSTATAGALDDASGKLINGLTMVGTAGAAGRQPFFSNEEIKIVSDA